MRRSLTWLGLGATLVAACAGDGSAVGGHGDDATPTATPATTLQSRMRAPLPVPPRIPDVAQLDQNRDRIDDRFDRAPSAIRSVVPATPGAPGAPDRIGVEAIFTSPIGQAELDAFVATGGVVRHVFRAVSYGFTGTLPRDAVSRAARALGSQLLLLQPERRVKLHLDEATRVGRARPVWAGGFAGNPTGFSGGAGVTIAILDTGVDGTHPDLAGRMVGWGDYTSSSEPSPIDPRGHGSHVAGIALGSGAAFGVGPSTLHVTDADDLSLLASGDFLPHPVHVSSAVALTATARWGGGGATTASELALLTERDGDPSDYAILDGPATGSSPLTHAFAATVTDGSHVSVGLLQNANRSIHAYTIATSIAGYPAVGDGLPALRGLAAKSGWYGARVFPTVGEGSTLDIAAAMDDVVAQRETLSIKVANLSFGIDSGDSDVTQRAKANSMVDNGIVVVASGGNGGPETGTGDPGRAANLITVVATNDRGAVTDYSSRGSVATSDDQDDKPDLAAPGGSLLTSQILSVDSNTADGDDGSLPDAVADDYASIDGTSMASPFVAGAAALVIEALERSGVTWSFQGTSSPFRVKTLLLASATETNLAREGNTGNPTLGRSTVLKDQFEGWGLINVDAAVEAAALSYADFSASTAGGTFDRRAWGRRVGVAAGKTVRFSLAVPTTGDFDLHLFDATPGAKGNPVLRAAGDRAGTGVAESLAYTATADATLYLFVKRVAGSGTFSVTSATYSCGNGTLEPGEDCDEGSAGPCCTATCRFATDGTTCNDGSVCTKADTCTAGKCSGEAAITCAPPDGCHAGLCDAITGACSFIAAPDGTRCTDGVCGNGFCLGNDGGLGPGAGLGEDVSLIADSAALFVGGGGCTCDAAGSEPRNQRSIAALLALGTALLLISRRRMSREIRG